MPKKFAVKISLPAEDFFNFCFKILAGRNIRANIPQTSSRDGISVSFLTDTSE